MSDNSKKSGDCDPNEKYYFGNVKEYSLEMIEEEILNESLYLDVFAGSDIRFKKEISPLDDALSKTLKLNGVSWKWRGTEFPERKFNERTQVGFIAQNVTEILPEAVGKDSDGYLGINYAKIVPLLTEAIKNQQTMIESLEKRLSEIEKQR